MQSILNLIRWKNLAIIVLVQVLIKYALFESFGIDTALTNFNFTLLVLATLCIAAAGNVINDIYDVETDMVNKPNHVIVGKSISEKIAYNWFITLNVIGVGIGFYLSSAIDKNGLFALFVIISTLLYVYASYLKRVLLIGNLVISILVATSLIIVPLFDLLPAVTANNQGTQLTMFKIVLDYALFAFLINLIREVIKDLEDVDGDHKAGMNTLPIAIGRLRATKIVFALTLLPLFALIYYIVVYLYKQPLAVAYFLVFVLGPMIYITTKVFNAETRNEYNHLSKILKLVMLTGMLSLLLYPFILK